MKYYLLQLNRYFLKSEKYQIHQILFAHLGALSSSWSTSSRIRSYQPILNTVSILRCYREQNDFIVKRSFFRHITKKKSIVNIKKGLFMK